MNTLLVFAVLHGLSFSSFFVSILYRNILPHLSLSFRFFYCQKHWITVWSPLTRSFWKAGVAQSVQWLSYALDDRDSILGRGNCGISFLHHCVHTSSEFHPASCPVGTGGSYPVVKRPGRVSDHSPPSGAEVKNAWSYTSTPQYPFTFTFTDVLFVSCMMTYKLD